VADLPILGPVTAFEPTLAAHVATKNYVDTTRDQSTVNARTANYTLSLSDAGKTVEMNSGSATTVTIPTNAAAAFPLGTVIWITRQGAGTVTVAGSGVTLRARSGVTAPAQYAVGRLWKRAGDEWFLIWI
jgi:hypothetical protein